ncbi:hypothetical protein SDC9_121828 [bioreactor metagenome]|uniref:Uncharacterized protein n=1 Tax=bioreactor metagenome TaxID=1076179 RepID=A0A645CD13_9ZZZZ
MIKNNILAEFEIRIEELVNTRPLIDLQERFKLIEEINEEFFRLTEQNLPQFLLSQLSDWVLLEVLNDRDVDKVSNNEFAILSQRQLRRRDKRENSVGGEVMDYLNMKYVKKEDSLAKKVKKDIAY